MCSMQNMGTLPPPCRMSIPISISNPDLARHSTELFMDSGFSPLSQRMGAMVAFNRFEDFVRWGCRGVPGRSCMYLLGAAAVVGEQKRVEETKLVAAEQHSGQFLFLPKLEVRAEGCFQYNSYLVGTWHVIWVHVEPGRSFPGRSLPSVPSGRGWA